MGHWRNLNSWVPPTVWGEHEMRGLGYDRILAGTALALILALAPNAYAQPDMLEAGVPMPARATLPPPTGADVGDKDAAATTGTVTAPTATTAPAVTPAATTPAEAAPEAAPSDPLASL